MNTKTRRQDDLVARHGERVGNNLFARIASARSVSRLQAQRLLRRVGELSIVEWRVLWDLSEVGPLTIGEIAKIQHVDHSQLSRALPGMRDKGLVKMDQDRSDGRQIMVDITPAGQKAYDSASPVMQRRRSKMRDSFTKEEITLFIDMLDRFEETCREPIDHRWADEAENDE